MLKQFHRLADNTMTAVWLGKTQKRRSAALSPPPEGNHQ